MIYEPEAWQPISPSFCTRLLHLGLSVFIPESKSSMAVRIVDVPVAI
jgi:hypothetical protein